MRLRNLVLIVFISLPLISCGGTSPQKVGLDYWKARVQFDRSCLNYVEDGKREQAEQDLTKAKKEMEKVYSDLDDYRYDLSQVRGVLMSIKTRRARIRVTGTALVYKHDGSVLDKENVNEVFELTQSGIGWKIDYDYNGY